MTDIVDEDLSSAAGRRRASVATTPATKSAAAAAVATSRRSAFVASAGCRRSGKARFGLAVLLACPLVFFSRIGRLRGELKY